MLNLFVIYFDMLGRGGNLIQRYRVVVAAYTAEDAVGRVIDWISTIYGEVEHEILGVASLGLISRQLLTSSVFNHEIASFDYDGISDMSIPYLFGHSNTSIQFHPYPVPAVQARLDAFNREMEETLAEGRALNSHMERIPGYDGGTCKEQKPIPKRRLELQ